MFSCKICCHCCKGPQQRFPKRKRRKPSYRLLPAEVELVSLGSVEDFREQPGPGQYSVNCSSLKEMLCYRCHQRLQKESVWGSHNKVYATCPAVSN